eukprot:2492997-Amphidinium_carterae.1
MVASEKPLKPRSSSNGLRFRCGLFTVKKIGDEYFTFMVQCEDPKAIPAHKTKLTKQPFGFGERNHSNVQSGYSLEASEAMSKVLPWNPLKPTTQKDD